MIKVNIRAPLLFAIALGMIMVVAAKAETAEKTVELRQALMKNFRSLTKDIGKNLKSENYEEVAVLTERWIDVLTDERKVFNVDTRGSDVDSDSKDRIWEDIDAFQSQFDTLNADLATLLNRATSKDKSMSKQAYSDVSKHCKSCHSVFKE